MEGFGITWSVGVRNAGIDVVRNTNPSEVFIHPFVSTIRTVYVPSAVGIHHASIAPVIGRPFKNHWNIPVPLANKESKDIVITGAVGKGFTTTTVVALVALQPLALVTVME